MPVFLCRWPNGSVSIVQARNKTEAIIRLDEFDNAEAGEIRRLDNLLLDFELDDEGDLQLNLFGGRCERNIRDLAYPDLEALLRSDELQELGEESDEYRAKVREGVEHERTRQWESQDTTRARKPKTELGKRLQQRSGAASVLIDRWIEDGAREMLETFDDDDVQ